MVIQEQDVESVTIQLTDVVEVVEGGQELTNRYLEAGYVLLAVVGHSSLRKVKRADGGALEWVRHDVRYALGRRAGVPHFVPSKPDWLVKREAEETAAKAREEAATQCGIVLHDHNQVPHRCVLALSHGGLHIDESDIVFSEEEFGKRRRADEPSAPPANEDPGTGVPT